MIELPKTKTKPQFTMSKLSMLLYGAPKIGKSTFCSRAQDALFVATEPGLNHLEVASVQVNTWREFLETMALLAKGGHSFKILVIDTIDKLCDFCNFEICGNAKVQTLGDMGYGKGYAVYKNELKRVFQKIFALDMGVILTSHAQLIELDTPTGRQTKWVPTFEKCAREILMPMVDIIGFAQNVVSLKSSGERVETRVLQTKTSSLWEAGDRTGRLPETLPFAYQAFEQALTKATKKETANV
ncbi:MAG: ATP-binding protein [Proteobacteria bacterium]|nr:ATP-binding protein [Pseudomonadota bacterium]